MTVRRRHHGASARAIASLGSFSSVQPGRDDGADAPAPAPPIARCSTRVLRREIHRGSVAAG